MKHKIYCKFFEVPENTNFYAYLNPNKPLDCHTIPCFKENNNSVHCREFSALKLELNEPVYYYSE